MQIRKQSYELTADDLRQYPIWEYALDEEEVEGQDEATVRPLDKIPSNLADRSQVVLAVIVTLADGTDCDGMITCPSRLNWTMADLMPSLVLPSGILSFWLGIRQPKLEDVAPLYERLGRSPEEVFPATLESLVAVDGERLLATVEGFYHYDWEPGKRMYPFEEHLHLQVTVRDENTRH